MPWPTTINVPDDVYLVALDLMNVARPSDPAEAKAVLRMAEGRTDYYQPFLVTDEQAGPRGSVSVTAFGAALAMFVSLSGPFAEDGGEFASVSGWQEDP